MSRTDCHTPRIAQSPQEAGSARPAAPGLDGPPQLTRPAPAGALLAFLLVPGHPLGMIGGLPWGPLALSCAVLVGCAVFGFGAILGRRLAHRVAMVAIALALLKVGVALTAPTYGLEASYHTGEKLVGEPERSTVWPRAPFTRLDSALDFGGDEFPLFFFNDSERFNSTSSERLDRGRALAWSARWQGYLQIEADRLGTVWLTASGPGELMLDGKPLLKVDAEGRATAQVQVALSPGAHPLQVQYVRKRERSPYLKVEANFGGQRQPLAAPLLTAEAYSAERLLADRWARAAARAVDLAYLALLAITLLLAPWERARAARPAGASPWARWERPLLALIPLGFLVHGGLLRLDRVGKMVFLGGGQDWLTHETLARDIQLNGPLMALGAPLGSGALYYAQPFYPYYLALLHTLSGEDLYGPITLQVVGLGVAAVLVYYLAKRLFGVAAALAALALTLGVLIPFELAWVARLLLSEALYFWLMPAAVLGLVELVAGGPWRCGSRLSFRPPLWLAAVTGTLLGLACVTRGTTLLYLPPLAVLLWIGLRRRAGVRVPEAPRGHSAQPSVVRATPMGRVVPGSTAMESQSAPQRAIRRGAQRDEQDPDDQPRGRAAPRTGLAAATTLAIVLGCAGLVIGLVPLRNMVVAGKPALTASSGGVNLEKLHRPSSRVSMRNIDRDPFQQMLNVDRPTREVIEYLRQDPLGYFGSYLPLAAYTLGIGSALNDLLDEQPVQLHPDLLILGILYLLAVLLVPRTRSLESGLVHAFIAIHFLTMLVFAPYDYENRLVMPMYLFVTVIAAAGLVHIGALLLASERRRRAPRQAGLVGQSTLETAP